MSRRSIRVAVTAALLVALLGSSALAARPAGVGERRALASDALRPDIVLLLLDDMPQMDDRIWNRLPTIKRLFLDQGVRFGDYIGNDPLCCPGRANLLTGQWSDHHGVVRNDARLFDPTVSIATELKAAGYWTAMFGKYFNLTDLLKDRTPPGWSRTFLFSGRYWNYTAYQNGRRLTFGSRLKDYSTSQIRRQALAALRAAPVDKPRFVWLSPYAIHAGRDQYGKLIGRQPAALPRDLDAPECRDIPPWWTPAVGETDLSDKPAWIQGRKPAQSQSLWRSCAALLAVDRMLAAVLADFEAQGRPEPMVILTVDNGMGWGAHHWYSKYVPYATPIPLFIHWPAVLGTQPGRIDTTMTNVDIAPTLCALAGCEMGPFPSGYGVDGIDMLPVLLAGGGPSGREVVFVEHPDETDAQDMPGWNGLRTTTEAGIGRWSYTEYETGETELYDLSGGPCWEWQEGMPGDPCELTNLADDPDHAQVGARLAATLAAREDHPARVLRSRR